MPAIRITNSAAPLIAFCRRHDQPEENACFDTYAALVVFAASCGLHFLKDRKPRPPLDSEYLKQLVPVDLDIFKNQHLFPNLLLIGLAADGSQAIARDEDRLCKLIEAYAHEGFQVLAAELEKSTHASFHLDLARLLRETTEDFEKSQNH